MLTKIFFVIPNMLHHGGAERVLSNILHHIDTQKYEATLVLLEEFGDLLQDLPPEIKVIDLKVSRIRYLPLKLIPLLYREKPDMVFTAWGEISAFLSPFIPLFPKTKFIARETNVVSQHVQRKEIRFFYRWYYRFDVIIAQSDDMKNDLIQNFNIREDHIVKINNPVNFDLINKQLENQEFPSEYLKDKKNVLAVGNLTHRKGFDRLIEVFSHLKDEAVHLHIMGIGVDEEKLKAHVQALGLSNVGFLGLKDNPYPYMRDADLFVLSSRYEGFPNVLLEANACGTYALCHDAPGGIREIIQDKLNGEIDDIENHEAFAKHLIKILDCPKDSDVIKESIRSRYSLEQIMAKYNAVFDRFS